MIVMKFGGTSVESAAALERVAGIVKSRLARKPVVVVSAMGKTTNRLLAIAASAVAGHRENALGELARLQTYHLEEAQVVVSHADLAELRRAVHEHFQELTELVLGLSVLGELTPRSIDAIASYGERLSSRIVALVLRKAGVAATHLDAREFIVTNGRHTQATPDFEATYARLAAVPAIAARQVVVMGGFLGATPAGVTTTLGRGGSDFSASIAGAGIGAEEIQIWTDVDGMLTCDPSVLPGGHRVRTISFAEAAELAYFGAKVLHPATMVPAMEKNIPVLILNSRKPEVEGTRIVAQPVPCSNVVKSIACRKNAVVLNVRSLRMFQTHGFLRRVFEIFDRHETSVDMVSTSEVSVSLTLDAADRLPAIVAEIGEFSSVSCERGQAIVCLVGEGVRESRGIGGRVFRALGPINVKMVSQGASSMSLGLVVHMDDLSDAVRRLHEEFFRELDPAVFDA